MSFSSRKVVVFTRFSMPKQEYQIVIVVTVLVVIAAFLTLINQISDKSLMGVKAYISGEGQWTKAQKQAAQSLTNYIVLGDDLYFEQFVSSLEVYKGDQRARNELSGKNPDLEIVVEGFRAGNNSDKNIPYLIWTYQNFKNISFMADAIQIWIDADTVIEEFEQFGYEIRQLKDEGDIDSLQTRILLQHLITLDSELTELENAFSAQISFTAFEVQRLMTIIRISGTVLLMIIGAIIILVNFKRSGQLHQTIKENQAKLSNILAHTKDIVFQLDIKTLSYQYLSDSIRDMLGYDPEEVLKEDVSFMLSKVHPDDRVLLPYNGDKPDHNELKKKTNSYTEIRIKNRKGQYIWVSIARNIILDENMNPVSIVGSVRDITDKKQNEMVLSKSLDEKNLLLSEIHHRVKNNLAIISALLELQSDITNEYAAKEALQKSQSRIRSIATVHEMLYKTGDFSGIDLNTYIRTLFNRISELNDPEKRVAINLEIADVKMNIMHGAPFGLLLNELITNSFKHAFKDMSDGLIKIKIKQKGKQVIFQFADNGVGLTADAFESGTSDAGLGLTLIKALIQQLNGSYTIDNFVNGFNLTLRFEI